MLIHIGNVTFTLSPVWVAVIAFVVLYFAGTYIEPVGGLIAFVAALVGKFFARLHKLLEVFEKKLDANHESKYPGLRTTVIVIDLIIALAALMADVYNSLQALTALWGDTSISLPPLPSFVQYSMGVLFLAIPCLFGAVLTESTDVIPVDARVFEKIEKRGWFYRGIVFSFWLSLATSVAFYSLRVFFLANSDSGATHLLQLTVFVCLSALVPMMGLLAVFILGLGFHAVLSLLLTIVCFVASFVAHLCEVIRLHFIGEKEGRVRNLGVFDEIDGKVKYVREGTFAVFVQHTPNTIKQLPAHEETTFEIPHASPASVSQVTQIPEPEQKEETQELVPVVPDPAPLEEANGHQDTQTAQDVKKKIS